MTKEWSGPVRDPRRRLPSTLSCSDEPSCRRLPSRKARLASSWRATPAYGVSDPIANPPNP